MENLFEVGRHELKIIVAFVRIKGITFENREQFKSFIKRNKKDAFELKGYSIERIIKTLKYLETMVDFKYTISSVGKYVDEDLTKLAIKNTKTIKI